MFLVEHYLMNHKLDHQVLIVLLVYCIFLYKLGNNIAADGPYDTSKILKAYPEALYDVNSSF